MEDVAMPRQTSKPPAYQRHKASGQARVKIAGRDYWCGVYGSEESYQEYQRLLAEWRLATAGHTDSAGAAPPSYPTAKPTPLTVAELIARYRSEHVVSYYVKNGKPTSEQDNIRQALRPVRELYGHTPAASFGPLALKAVRQSLIDRDHSRRFINKQLARIRGLWRWAVSCELVPASSIEALQSVPGLREGRSGAREKPPVGPVSDDLIELTIPHLTPTVAAMVRVQRLCGCRPQEVVLMRADGIDRTDPECWLYRPDRHKTQHHGRERIIFIGPRAQAIITPFLDEADGGFLFSPRRSENARNEAKRGTRATPRWPSHCKRKPKPQPKRSPGDHYAKTSYRRAINKACIKAGILPWFPHQIRHTSATEIRRNFDIESAQVILGHSHPDTTLIYAERDMGKAREVMRQTG
jgi:integrase